MSLLLAFGMAGMGCSSGGSSQDYSSVTRSAQSVRSKLNSYSAQAVALPSDVCQGSSTPESGSRWAAEAKLVKKAGTAPDVDPQPHTLAQQTDVTKGPAGKVTVSQAESGWEIRSEGGTMAEVVRQLDPKVGVRVVARGRGAHAPIYARVRGDDWAVLLDQIARSVGMQVVEADGVRLVASAPLAVHLERKAARRESGDTPLESTFLRVENLQQTANLLAEFVVGCRGTLLILPEKEVLFVEDTAENLEAIRSWANALNQPEDALDRVYSRDRVERYGVPEATLPMCDAVPVEPDEVGPNMVPAGSLVLADALANDDDVIAGCGSNTLVASTANAVPRSTDVAEFLGLSQFGEHTWTSEAFAADARNLTREAEITDSWRVVRHEPLSSGLTALLQHRYAGHFRVRSSGWGKKILLSVREGYMDKINETIAEYDAVKDE